MREMKKFLSFTRDSRGKVTGRNVRSLSNTIHCSTGGGGSMSSHIIEINEACSEEGKD